MLAYSPCASERSGEASFAGVNPMAAHSPATASTVSASTAPPRLFFLPSRTFAKRRLSRSTVPPKQVVSGTAALLERTAFKSVSLYAARSTFSMRKVTALSQESSMSSSARCSITYASGLNQCSALASVSTSL